MDVVRDGVVDLLGVLAYGELSAFDRLAEDSRAAPTLTARTAMATMAAAEIGHFRLLERHLHGMGVSVDDAVRPSSRASTSSMPRQPLDLGWSRW